MVIIRKRPDILCVIKTDLPLLDVELWLDKFLPQLNPDIACIYYKLRPAHANPKSIQLDENQGTHANRHRGPHYRGK